MWKVKKQVQDNILKFGEKLPFGKEINLVLIYKSCLSEEQIFFYINMNQNYKIIWIRCTSR